MMKPTRGIACLLALGMMAACVQAGETTGTCTKSKSACCSKAGAPAIVTNVVYRVNETETPCSEMAGKLAEESGSKIEYLAAGKVYDNELDAKAALAEQIEAAVAEMLEVRYAVNGETTACPTSAKLMASKNGGKMMYRAVGRDFGCEQEARDAVGKAKTVLAKLDEGNGKSCCASGASKATMVAASGAKTTCAGLAGGAKTACAGSSAATVTAAKASGLGCCASKIKAAKAAGEQAPACCEKKVKTVAASASECPKTKAVNTALAEAIAKYDAMQALSKELVVADAASKG